jgi:hypothetical protein
MRRTDDPLFLDQDRYLLRDALALTPDAVRLLLARIQLVVVPSVERKRHFQVVFGSRLFNLAAQTLEPDEDIKVLVVRNADREVIDHLRYLDLAVLPLVLSLDGTILEFYDLVESSPSLQGFAWRATSKASFAKAIGVSRIRDRSNENCSKKKGGGVGQLPTTKVVSLQKL